jgi:MraZ protein
MYQLKGEYDCKADAKGRLRLPSSLIKQLDESGSLNFTINRGFEQHLMLYPSDVWDKKTKEINKLNLYNSKERAVVRYFYRGASELTVDSADRILLPKSLMDYAGITKEVVLFAYNEQIEVWSKEKYEEMLGEEPKEFGEITENIFGGNQSDSEQDGIS